LYRDAPLFLSLLVWLCIWSQAQTPNSVPVEKSHRRLALVIGNAAYPWSRLHNPVNDARSMQTVLEQDGFQVSSIFDADAKGLARAIESFAARLRPGDVALFYYSGHGMQINGENYLLPTDFEGKDQTEINYVSYAMNRVREYMERSGASLKILIFDACRDNPFKGVRLETRGLARIAGGAGTFIAFATAPGMTASDNPKGDYGLFTAVLLDVLRIPGLPLDEVFERVSEQVDRTSGHAQQPWHVSTVVEPFYFIASSVRTSGLEQEGRLLQPTHGITVDAKKARKAFNKGSNLVDENKYEEAIRSFNDAIRWQSSDASFFFKRGLAELAMGRQDQAIADFQTAIRLDAKDADNYAALGLATFAIGDYQKSIDALSQAIRLKPDDATLYSAICASHAALGQSKLAIEECTKAVDLDAKLAYAYLIRAGAYSQFDQYEPAINDLTRAIELPPPVELGTSWTFFCYVLRAVFNSKIDKPRQAIPDLDEAVRLQPQSGFLYVARGEAYRSLGNCTTAITDFEKTINLGASSFSSGWPLQFLTTVPFLAQRMDRILNQAPLIGLGLCHAQLGHRQQALDVFSQALRLQANDDTYHNRGLAYASLGEYKNAILDYDRSLELNPELASAYLDRGVAYANLGNCARALDNYSEAIRLNPKNPWSFNNRASCYDQFGQYQSAIRDSDEAIHLKPDFAEAFVNRGVAHSGLRQYDLAIRNYGEAIRISPNYGLAFNNRGKAKSASGDEDGAKADFARAQELGYKE
jgi:tetratricopeptide (TPR) repeat protein